MHIVLWLSWADSNKNTRFTNDVAGTIQDYIYHREISFKLLSHYTLQFDVHRTFQLCAALTGLAPTCLSRGQNDVDVYVYIVTGIWGQFKCIHQKKWFLR